MIDKLLKIVEREFGVKAAELQALELFALEGVRPNSFEEFLIRSRVRLFMKLHVLSMLEGEFVPCLDELTLYETNDDWQEESWTPIETRAPAVIKTRVSSAKLFSDFLCRTGVAAIDCEVLELPHEYVDCEGKIDTSRGAISPPHPETFVLLGPVVQLVVAKERMYAAARHDEFARVLAARRDDFAKFVEKYKDGPSVPHRIYVDWLLTWFPGKVRVRGIEG